MPEDPVAVYGPSRTADVPLERRYLLDRPERVAGVVRSLVGLSLGLAAVGVVVGLRMALHATEISCPNGTFFPVGTTDFRCFAHDHAGEGTAVIVLSLGLALLACLCGVVWLELSQLRRK